MAKTSMDPRLLETESIPKLLWQYALPAVITTLSTSVYNLIDRIFIGHGAGAMAISGLALSLPIMTFLQAFGTLVGVGASTRISIVLGMKDREWAERILGNALFLTVIMWALLTVLCLAFLEPLLKIFGGSENTIPYAADYLRIIIPGNIFANLSYSFCNIIRASGSPIRSMTIMISGMVLNAILAPIFIFWFDWGIQGAAIATVIAMFVTAVQTMHFFLKKDAFIRFTRPNLKPAKKIVNNILSIGMSPFLINLAGSAVAIILNGRLAAKGGDLAVGAYGIVNSYGILFVMFVIGLCQGMQPIAGYNYGARKPERVRKVFSLSIKVGTAITTLGFLLMEIFPRTAANVFTTDEQLIEITRVGALRLPAVPLCGIPNRDHQLFPVHRQGAAFHLPEFDAAGAVPDSLPFHLFGLVRPRRGLDGHTGCRLPVHRGDFHHPADAVEKAEIGIGGIPSQLRA